MHSGLDTGPVVQGALQIDGESFEMFSCTDQSHPFMDIFSVHRLLAFARSINTLLHAACCPLIKAAVNSAILVKR